MRVAEAAPECNAGKKHQSVNAANDCQDHLGGMGDLLLLNNRAESVSFNDGLQNNGAWKAAGQLAGRSWRLLRIVQPKFLALWRK